jgi:hypothetical protein
VWDCTPARAVSEPSRHQPSWAAGNGAHGCTHTTIEAQQLKWAQEGSTKRTREARSSTARIAPGSVSDYCFAGS